MSYGGDVNRGPFLDTFNWIFNVIALSLVLLRLISRRLLENQKWDIGDFFISIAMLANLARSIHVSVAISKGFGQHLGPLLEANPVKFTQLLRLMIILQAIGLWTFTLPKLPIVALLVKLFNTSRRTTILLWSSVGVLISIITIMTFITFFQCDPVESQWNLEIKGKCWDKKVNVDIGYVAGAYSAFLDFAFALYPILQISKLQMERSRKISVAASLGLGFLASIATIYKQTTISALTSGQDQTFTTIPLEVWNSVEGTFLLVAAAVPMTRPIMLRIGTTVKNFTSQFTSVISTNRTNRSGGTSTGGTTLQGTQVTLNTSNGGKRFSRGHYRLSSKDDIMLLESSVSIRGGTAVSENREPIEEGGIYKKVDYRVDDIERGH